MAIKELIPRKKYQVRVHFRDHFGRPRDKKQVVYGTKKDATIVHSEMIKAINQNVDYDMKFKELFEKYLEDKSMSVVEETIRKNREIYETFLNKLSRKKVKDIKTSDCLNLINDIAKHEGSMTQKNKAITLLKAISKFGHDYYDYYNFAIDLKLLKKKVSDKFVYNTFTPEEFEYVIQFESQEVFRLLYEIYFWAGLRRGEALALSPRDLLDSKELYVHGSINSYGKKGTPKNESSYRKVLIHDDLYNRVFPYSRSKGKYLLGGMSYLPPSTVNRRFKETIIAANKQRKVDGLYELPLIRIHDLRHSHASFLASKNVPISAVSARFGHSSINETMKTYIHLFKGDDQRAIEVINEYILEPTKRPTN